VDEVAPLTQFNRSCTQRIGAATVQFAAVDPAGTEAQAALARYLEELDARFPTGFAPAAGDARDLDALRPPHGTFLVVRSDDTTVGCAGLHRIDDATGEIKRMWIDPDWRGLGLGRRLLDRVEDAARDRGRERVVLDTNETLVEAIALYERAGYEPIDRYNDNPYAQRWFAKAL
jgi:GNAT superfamily N-acetyltransferase